MAWIPLNENYKDLAWEGLRKYRMINNPDGTVSFEDATVYTNEGESAFDSNDINATNSAINDIMSNPAPISRGGTGATNGNQALNNLGAKDYIVEEGAGEGFIWEKWNSGLLRVRGVLRWNQYQLGCDIPYGAIFISNAVNFSYPITVVDWDTTATISVSITAAGIDIPAKVGFEGGRTATFRWTNPTPYESGVYGNPTAYVMIEGRWK